MTARTWVTAATITGVAVLTSAALVLGGLAVLGSTMYDADLVDTPGWNAAAAGPSSVLAAAGQRKASTPDDPAAVALLRRAAAAAVSVAYAGATVSIAGSVTESVTVANLPGIGTVVSTAGKSTVLAGEGGGSIADSARVLGLLADNYSVLRPRGQDRVIAGRPTTTVEALRPDGTLAARFWLDRRTGLLLRRDLYAQDGSVVSSMAFTSLRLGREAVGTLPPMAADPWTVTLDDDQLAVRREAGCTCALVLPDGLSLLRARVSSDEDGDSPDVVHLLYSDGLTEVSVFDQPGRLDPASETLAAKGFQRTTYGGIPVLERMVVAGGPGATSEWVWQCGRSVVTLVAPAQPYEEAQQRALDIVSALYVPPTQPQVGFGARVSRGWSRLVGAVQRSWDRLTASTADSQATGVG